MSQSGEKHARMYSSPVSGPESAAAPPRRVQSEQCLGTPPRNLESAAPSRSPLVPRGRPTREDSRGVYFTGAPMATFADVDTPRVPVAQKQTVFRIKSTNAGSAASPSRPSTSSKAVTQSASPASNASHASMSLTQSTSAGRYTAGTAPESPVRYSKPVSPAPSTPPFGPEPGALTASSPPGVHPRHHGGSAPTYISGGPFALNHSTMPKGAQTETVFRVHKTLQRANSTTSGGKAQRSQPGLRHRDHSFSDSDSKHGEGPIGTVPEGRTASPVPVPVPAGGGGGGAHCSNGPTRAGSMTSGGAVPGSQAGKSPGSGRQCSPAQPSRQARPRRVLSTNGATSQGNGEASGEGRGIAAPSRAAKSGAEGPVLGLSKSHEPRANDKMSNDDMESFGSAQAEKEQGEMLDEVFQKMMLLLEPGADTGIPTRGKGQGQEKYKEGMEKARVLEGVEGAPKRGAVEEALGGKLPPELEAVYGPHVEEAAFGEGREAGAGAGGSEAKETGEAVPTNSAQVGLPVTGPSGFKASGQACGKQVEPGKVGPEAKSPAVEEPVQAAAASSCGDEGMKVQKLGRDRGVVTLRPATSHGRLMGSGARLEGTLKVRGDQPQGEGVPDKGCASVPDLSLASSPAVGSRAQGTEAELRRPSTATPLGAARSAESTGQHGGRLRRPYSFGSLLSRSLSVPLQSSASSTALPTGTDNQSGSPGSSQGAPVYPGDDVRSKGAGGWGQCFPSLRNRKSKPQAQSWLSLRTHSTTVSDGGKKGRVTFALTSHSGSSPAIASPSPSASSFIGMSAGTASTDTLSVASPSSSPEPGTAPGASMAAGQKLRMAGLLSPLHALKFPKQQQPKARPKEGGGTGARAATAGSESIEDTSKESAGKVFEDLADCADEGSQQSEGRSESGPRAVQKSGVGGLKDREVQPKSQTESDPDQPSSLEGLEQVPRGVHVLCGPASGNLDAECHEAGLLTLYPSSLGLESVVEESEGEFQELELQDEAPCVSESQPQSEPESAKGLLAAPGQSQSFPLVNEDTLSGPGAPLSASHRPLSRSSSLGDASRTQSRRLNLAVENLTEEDDCSLYSAGSGLSTPARSESGEWGPVNPTAAALGVWGAQDTTAAQQLSLAMDLLLAATRPLGSREEEEEEGGLRGKEAMRSEEALGSASPDSSNTATNLRAASELLLLASKNIEQQRTGAQKPQVGA